MQTASEWQDAIETGRISEDYVQQEEKSQSDFIKSMLEAGQMYSGNVEGNRKRWKDLSNEEKQATCTYQTGKNAFRKMVDGNVIQVPLYCNLCENCYKAKTEKMADRIKGFSEQVKNSDTNGQWRMKMVDDATEAQSLKKRIKRNQEGRHFEIVSSEDGKSEVWSYIENEPGKNMNEIYGELAEPEDIDFETLYKRNRETGKKVSTGKAFRQPVSKPREGTKKILVPQIVVKDESKHEEVDEIMEQTNYIELATTGDKVINLFNLQFKHILKNLETAGIKVDAVKYSYIHMSEEELIEDWNQHVYKWMSINASPPLELDEGKADNITQYLVYPESKKSELPIQ